MAAHGVGAERGVQRRHIRVFRGEAIARNRREATVLARSGGVERLTLPMKTLAAQANGNVCHDAGTAGRHGGVEADQARSSGTSASFSLLT